MCLNSSCLELMSSKLIIFKPNIGSVSKLLGYAEHISYYNALPCPI